MYSNLKIWLVSNVEHSRRDCSFHHSKIWLLQNCRFSGFQNCLLMSRKICNWCYHYSIWWAINIKVMPFYTKLLPVDGVITTNQNPNVRVCNRIMNYLRKRNNARPILRQEKWPYCLINRVHGLRSAWSYEIGSLTASLQFRLDPLQFAMAC